MHLSHRARGKACGAVLSFLQSHSSRLEVFQGEWRLFSRRSACALFWHFEGMLYRCIHTL